MKHIHCDAYITATYTTHCQDWFHPIADNWRLPSSEGSKSSITAHKSFGKLLFGNTFDSFCVSGLKGAVQIPNWMHERIKNSFTYDSARIFHVFNGVKHTETLRKGTWIGKGTDRSNSLAPATDICRAWNLFKFYFREHSDRTNIIWSFRKRYFVTPKF